MNRTIVTVFILVAALSAAGAETSPLVGTKELIEHPRDYDGKVVVFVGEAIGAPMRRGDSAWVNVLDPDAAMGVFMPASMLRGIANYGSNRTKGDRLKVAGVFHRACPDHGGDMDIHAASVEVVAAGTSTPHPVDRVKLALVPASFIAAALLYILWKKREAAARKGNWLS
jgi:hypothetical protein